MQPPLRCACCGHPLTQAEVWTGELRQRAWHGRVVAVLHPACVSVQLRFVFDGRGKARVLMAGRE